MAYLDPEEESGNDRNYGNSGGVNESYDKYLQREGVLVAQVEVPVILDLVDLREGARVTLPKKVSMVRNVQYCYHIRQEGTLDQVGNKEF